MDIQRDGAGKFFELRVPTHLSDSLDVSVMQAEPTQRHLLRAQDNAVQTVRGAIRVPTVIVAVNFARVPKKRPNELDSRRAASWNCLGIPERS
jgi:hypothetical protein